MKADTCTFRDDVINIVKQIPSGHVLTYGKIALLAARPTCSRLVGATLHGTSAQGVPCHRVVNSQGRLAPCWPEQRRRLEQEGVVFKSNGCVDLAQSAWKLDIL